MENHYKVALKTRDSQITVDVFTNGKVEKEELKQLGIQRCIEFMNEWGLKVNPDEITPYGFVDKGVWSN